MSHGYGAVTRRTLIVGAITGIAAAGLGGCRENRWYPSDITPDQHILRGVINEKTRMITRYEDAVSAGKGPVELLERLLDHHRHHLEVLRDRLPEHGDARQEEAAAPQASPSASPDPVPDAPLSAADLRVAEESAASARGRQSSRISESGLAQIIAGIGACETGHAHMLSET